MSVARAMFSMHAAMRAFIPWGPCVMRQFHQQLSGRIRSKRFSLSSTRYAAYLLTALVLLVSLAVAQSSSQLNGSVSDPSGAIIADAKITLTGSATGLQRTTTSNGAGLYQFLDVPPGNYRLEASASGFAAVVSKVTLVVKTPATVNIKFQVAGVETSVTVEGQTPLINRTDASLGNTIEENQIGELPIADRNVVQLLSLQPGVAYLSGAAEDNK